MSNRKQSQVPGKSRLLLVIIVLLVVIMGLLFFVVLKGPSISSYQEAQKAGQEVTKNIEDIKSTLNQIKEGLTK